MLNSEIENKRRQRFNYAHELGHFMCHLRLRDRFEDGEETLNDFRDEIETEAEANVFASWLLMPANILRDEFNGIGWNTVSVSETGNRFECFLQASALRFFSLFDRPIAFVVSRDGMIIWGTKSKSAPYMSAFCLGGELPPDSHAHVAHMNGGACSTAQEFGFSWSDAYNAWESQYFDYSGRGYQHTCIEFGG